MAAFVLGLPAAGDSQLDRRPGPATAVLDVHRRGLELVFQPRGGDRYAFARLQWSVGWAIHEAREDEPAAACIVRHDLSAEPRTMAAFADADIDALVACQRLEQRFEFGLRDHQALQPRAAAI